MSRLAATIRPGEHLQLLLKEKAKPGSVPIRQIGVYEATAVEHPDRCQHLESICRQCLPDWEADYYVRRFEHGTTTGYRTIGCRCDGCRAFGKDEPARPTGDPS